LGGGGGGNIHKYKKSIQIKLYKSKRIEKANLKNKEKKTQEKQEHF